LRTSDPDVIRLPSSAGDAGQLARAIEACGRSDVYWSNEFFYRWMNSVAAPPPAARSLAAFGQHFLITRAFHVGRARKREYLRNLAEDGRFPGAAMALGRLLAKTGEYQAALDLLRPSLAKARQTNQPFDFHLLENQITALERAASGRPVHQALNRYLGDDDGYFNERICPVPFERIDVQENGNCAVCCAHWMPGFSLGNIMTDQASASELYNNERAVAVRQSMLDGSFRYCDAVKCPQLSGGRLPKKADNPPSPHVRRALGDGTLRFDRPRTVLLAFDQTCNLSCPSCRAQVITEKSQMQARKEELIETSIMPLLRKASILNINPAGEIFVSRPLRRLLSKLNRTDFPDLKLQIISNGTLFSRREWDKFAGIHDMVHYVRISTDGATKETFEKLRRGAVWDEFIENVNFLAELLKERVIQELWFSFTYQVGNFREMPAFVDMCANLAPGSRILFEKLENWGTFSAQEYESMAVHLTGHPLHDDFLSVIQSLEAHSYAEWIRPDYRGLIPASSS
jgi:Iron-sulfur cluster-binding domain